MSQMKVQGVNLDVQSIVKCNLKTDTEQDATPPQGDDTDVKRTVMKYRLQTIGRYLKLVELTSGANYTAQVTVTKTTTCF